MSPRYTVEQLRTAAGIAAARQPETERRSMNASKKAVTTAVGVAAVKSFLAKHGAATKSKTALNISEDLMKRVEALEATPEEVDRVADALATFGDFIRETLGQGEKKPAEDDVAEKFIGNRPSSGSLSDRDAIGRAKTKPYGGSPRDIRARESARADDLSSERDGFGRSRRKVYS